MADIETTVFKTWLDFVRHVTEERTRAGLWYRGQADPSWFLSSPFERYHMGSTKDIIDDNPIWPYSKLARDVLAGRAGWYKLGYDRSLRYFKESSKGMRGPHPEGLSDLEWLVLGRHYGLITSLLDWSSSPYIAAYFALEGLLKNSYMGISFSSNDYVCIWTLKWRDFVERPQPELTLVYDSDLNETPRIRGQQGCFTKLNCPEILELEGYLRSIKRESALSRLMLSKGAAATALDQLNKMNINAKTVYPDLGGAASYANNMAYLQSKLGPGCGFESELAT